jgi:hypothetical protein
MNPSIFKNLRQSYRGRLRELVMQGDAEKMANYRKLMLRWVQSGVTLREDEMGDVVATGLNLENTFFVRSCHQRLMKSCNVPRGLRDKY